MANAGVNCKTDIPEGAMSYTLRCHSKSESIAMQTTIKETTTTTITLDGKTRELVTKSEKTVSTSSESSSSYSTSSRQEMAMKGSTNQGARAQTAKPQSTTTAAQTQTAKAQVSSKFSTAKLLPNSTNKGVKTKSADDEPPPLPPLSTLPDFVPDSAIEVSESSRGAVSSSVNTKDSVVDILTPAGKFDKPNVGNHLECVISHMNDLLKEVDLMKYHLPLKRETIVEKMRDGVILCSMAIRIKSDSVCTTRIFNPLAPNNKVIATEEKLEQNRRVGKQTLATLGVFPQILPIDVIGQPVALLGILVKFVEVCLMANISPENNSKLVFLLDNPSSVTQMNKLQAETEEEVLLRWANRQLKDTKLKLENFHSSMANFTVMATLLEKIAPKGKKMSSIRLCRENKAKADNIVKNMKTLGLNDILKPSYLLYAAEGNRSNFESTSIKYFNTLACAAAFNKYPNYGDEIKEYKESLTTIKSLCRTGASDDTLRKWLNSFGLKQPVKNFNYDLRSGISLLTVWSCISPGIVNWKKVELKDPGHIKRPFIYAANCHEVMECVRIHNIKVNCDANDISTGNVKNTGALVFKMMLQFSKLRYKEMTGSTRYPDSADLLAWMKNVMKKSGNEIAISTLKDRKIFNTNLIGVLSERAINESDRKHKTKSYDFTFPDLCDLKNDKEKKLYSITLLHYLRSQNVSVQITEFNDKLEHDVLLDLLSQLKAINEAGSKDSIDG